MKKVLGIFLGLIAVIIVGVIGVGLFSASSSQTSLEDEAKAAATNVVIDASGYKQKIADALESKRDTIANITGMSTSEVDAAIKSLDIENWEACALPNNAVSTGTYSGSPLGVPGSITTYQDPSYITITASGQEVTMKVPDSAQGYLSYLSLVG